MPADLGLVMIRVVIGGLFMGHGLQKLTRWVGGYGLAGTAGYMESLGLRPGRLWALVAGLCETLGGALFALGLLNPVGSVLIGAVMLMAIARAHWGRGPWVANGGWEYALANLTVVTGVALTGPGAYAVDSVLGRTLPVVPILVAGLALALVVVVGSTVVAPVPAHGSQQTG
ncbi:MAG: DoxX family protein [Armatimonadota bacterium]|nr:DoxX family protein [Armatimonadota bacterium]MDR7447991.1 DoxX family protein [Armatimonadota bacterium]MDR7458255.1 DoxX family protein [Armatimonadota bacterium]MDR7478441.1 DoxX family protein [Armatimonadota bacterium]MDR7487375.1 DoxX family protein [Armatimonadota bacterium]